MRSAPKHPDEYDGEHLNTDEKLEAAGWAAGLDVWEQVGKGYAEHYLGDDVLGNAQLWSLQEAIRRQARRGSAVEEWITKARDQYVDGTERTGAWWVLDGLLDSYREHADTDTPLG